MTDIYVWMIVLAAAFLLICRVLTVYRSRTDIRSRREALQKPGIWSRIEAWQIMIVNTMHRAGEYRQELLKEKNRSTILFDVNGRTDEEGCTARKAG